MEEKHLETERCIFCGRERTVCDCNLGKLVGNADIVPMCYNCAFYDAGCCTNKNEKIQVKKPENKCKDYKLNLCIFKELVQPWLLALGNADS